MVPPASVPLSGVCTEGRTLHTAFATQRSVLYNVLIELRWTFGVWGVVAVFNVGQGQVESFRGPCRMRGAPQRRIR